MDIPHFKWQFFVRTLTCARLGTLTQRFPCSGPGPPGPPPRRTWGRSRGCRPTQWSSGGQNQTALPSLWCLRARRCLLSDCRDLCRSPAVGGGGSKFKPRFIISYGFLLTVSLSCLSEVLKRTVWMLKMLPLSVLLARDDTQPNCLLSRSRMKEVLAIRSSNLLRRLSYCWVKRSATASASSSSTFNGPSRGFFPEQSAGETGTIRFFF